jgi:hypothetical protein
LTGVSLDILYGYSLLVRINFIVGHDEFPSVFASPAVDFDIIVAGDSFAKETVRELPTDDFTCIEVDHNYSPPQLVFGVIGWTSALARLLRSSMSGFGAGARSGPIEASAECIPHHRLALANHPLAQPFLDLNSDPRAAAPAATGRAASKGFSSAYRGGLFKILIHAAAPGAAPVP